jgi:hypothetical protein
MPTPINPYVAGNPVGDSPAFIGRADVLREVLRVLCRPQDNAIVPYGQRRIGNPVPSGQLIGRRIGLLPPAPSPQKRERGSA